MNTARRFAYTRLAGPGRAGRYLLPANDGRAVSLISRYEEQGDLQRMNARGEWAPVRGTFWATRVLDDDELDVERNDAGEIARLGPIGEDVSVWDRAGYTDGFTTLRGALAHAAQHQGATP